MTADRTGLDGTRMDVIRAAWADRSVLVIGDVMLDRYLWGKVDRISPEAPVPVVDIERESVRLGGAANVARNVQALGAHRLHEEFSGLGRGRFVAQYVGTIGAGQGSPARAGYEQQVV